MVMKMGFFPHTQVLLATPVHDRFAGAWPAKNSQSPLGKVVEDRLHEDTYKLVNELQQRLRQVDQV
jgi:hypothetical protein